MGIGYKRVESLNADPAFIQTLSDIVKTHMSSGLQASTQFHLRCPMCTNEKCGNTKAYFGISTEDEAAARIAAESAADEAIAVAAASAAGEGKKAASA